MIWLVAILGVWRAGFAALSRSGIIDRREHSGSSVIECWGFGAGSQS